MESCVPSPVPKWYHYSTVTRGARKVGYDSSRDCQAYDRKARHKKVCKEVAMECELNLRHLDDVEIKYIH